ncbi:MAG: EAL domain-containing protein [Gammaproteobacteria bacterium]|nr:EAL domain-containing protein [Gammaproteobacteria bacterium]MCP5197845.1 EAL domain-containing protein [Gammaproteobacteria bacterium]
MKILYVEDNPVDADLAQRELARLAPDFVLDTATTFQEAFRLCQVSAYEVVLIDLRLPDGNGLDLLTHIREHQLPTAVVILTGSGYQESAVVALKSGADDYLVKRDDYLQRLPQALRDARTRYLVEVARKSYPLRVLYAEHNRFDIDLTRRYLIQHFPYIHLTVVNDATGCLARLPSEPFIPLNYEVLLLDYHLPGLNALEVTKILRQERHLDLPIVLVTSEGSEETVAQALRLGVSDYLIKHQNYLYELPAVLEKVHHQVMMAQEHSALQSAKRQYDELTARIPAGVYRFRMLHTGGAQFDYVSGRWCAMNGLDAQAVLEDAGLAFALVHPEDRAEFERLNAEIRLDPKMFAWKGRFLIHGETRWMSIESLPTRLENGDVVWDGVQIDTTERYRANEKQRLSAAVVANTRDGVVITDSKPDILAVNPAYSEMTGYSEAEVLGKNPRLLQSGRHDRAFYQAMWASLLQTGHWRGELWNRRKDGELYPQWLTISAVHDDQGETSHYVGILTDISQLKQTEAQLERLAHYDPLTNLPNRLLAQLRLEHAVDQAKRHSYWVGVLYIDLDQFKTINDSLGHLVGDQLLQVLAQRLSQRFRQEDTLARLGGDEFLVVLEYLQRPEEAASVAQNIIDLLEQPLNLTGDQDIYIGASVGISLYPDDGCSAAELIQHADTAVYQAKAQGRNTYRFYTETLTRAAYERLDLEGRLRRALGRGEFLLHYQPLISVQGKRIVGVEALVRWQPPGEALVSPMRFIPLAEETGLIVPLGEWVLRTACAQAKAWLDAGWPPLLLAVNLSARQFQQPNLIDQICAVLTDTGLPAVYLELEITESTLIDQGQQAVAATLAALKELGVRLAIDDFGTGYSSLAYLKRFPIDKLKIDQSFVRDIPQDSSDMEIAAAIIALARNLHLEVLAEGVETEDQLAFLRERDCDTWQGYLFSRPVPAADLATLLSQGLRLGQLSC